MPAHKGHHFHAVAGAEVAKGVMESNHHPVFRGNGVNLTGNVGVQVPQLGNVSVRVGPVKGRVGRIHLTEPDGDLFHIVDGKARVLPEVGIARPVIMAVTVVIVAVLVVALPFLGMVVVVVAFAQDAYESDFGGFAIHRPARYHFQVVGVQSQHFPGPGVGDVDLAGRGSQVRPRPKAGVDGAGQYLSAGRQQIRVMGIVHPHFPIAHHHQQQLAVIAEGHLDRPQRVSGRNQLLHRPLLRLHQIQANGGTQGKEMIQALVAPNRSQPEILRGTGRSRDESVGKLPVIGFHRQRSAGAAEHRDMPVAGIPVQIRAARSSRIEDVALHIPDVRADGQAIHLRIAGIVRMLRRDGKEVILQRHRRAVMGAGIHPNRLIGRALGGQVRRID